jgi:ATP-dependent helicase/nuclease subunit B
MKIYQSSTKEKFLHEIAHFAIKYFADNFSKLKIILPSGLLCSELQRVLIEKLKAGILPIIISPGELVAESDEIFKIPSEQIGTISKLEEKITLAETINSYKKLNYDLSQSLRLAPSLANLFFEFEANNINLSELKDLPALDQPQHWHIIYDFLSYALHNWQKKISSLQKMTRASYQKLTFEAELQRLKNNKTNFLLLAGITGSNSISNKFIKDVTKLSNAHVILSPTPDFNQKSEFFPEDALYQVHKLLRLIGYNNDQPTPLGTKKTSIIDKLIAPTSSEVLEQDIDYVEFENIFHEAEYIATKCLKAKDIGKIAIIVHNQQAKEQYCMFLDKYNLNYHDLLGVDILEQHAISLILLIAEHLCCEFNSKTFFTLLSHPLINSPQTQGIKNLIRKKNRLSSNLDTISELVNEYAGTELNEYYLRIHKILNIKLKSKNFNDIFRQIIKITESLIPDIWQKYPDIASSLTEIVQVNWQLALKNVQEFPELLQQVINGGRISDTKPVSNITICRAHEAALINYDLIIIADLNEDTYPLPAPGSPWLNVSMQKELKLDSSRANWGSALYDFYLNLQNKKVLLTRAKRQGSNKQTLPSPFILNLKHILGNKLHTKTALPEKNNISENKPDIYATSNLFPKQISATDIELLIRAPYNFYAKKILNLRKTDEIDEKPNLAEFGNFFHLVVEKYTRCYNNRSDKMLAITEIAESVLENSNIPDYSKKSWHTKLAAITPEFIEFDEKRRKNSVHIYSEIRGQIELDIAGWKINITAIADRIEINQSGIATILDYKTGVVPTKKEILSGLSPQLLVEAIILSEGGFAIESEKVHKLAYVKINSSKPYIKTTEIALTQNDLFKHKQGLATLLEHYINTKKFVVEASLVKYDDYNHLARRL